MGFSHWHGSAVNLCHWHTVLPASFLFSLGQPYVHDPWGAGGVVDVDDVYAALNEGRLRDTNPANPLQWYFGTPQEHAERIAYLVYYGWDHAEELTITVDASGEVAFEDGNHRLHALAYHGVDVAVGVMVCGDVDVLAHVFGDYFDEAEVG